MPLWSADIVKETSFVESQVRREGASFRQGATTRFVARNMGKQAKAAPAKGANVLRALPANGPQGKKLWEVQQAKAAKDAAQKRLNFEKESALAETRLVTNKRNAAAAAVKRASKKKRGQSSIPTSFASQADAAYWGELPAEEEKEIPELNNLEGPFKEGNGPVQEDGEGSDKDDEGAGAGEEEQEVSSDEERRLQTVRRRGPRDPPPEPEPATVSRSQGASNRLALALSKHPQPPHLQLG